MPGLGHILEIRLKIHKPLYFWNVELESQDELVWEKKIAIGRQVLRERTVWSGQGKKTRGKSFINVLKSFVPFYAGPNQHTQNSDPDSPSTDANSGNEQEVESQSLTDEEASSANSGNE